MRRVHTVCRRDMFHWAALFNGDISQWRTTSVTKMNQMFWGNYIFDQDISGWDVGQLTDMVRMWNDPADVPLSDCNKAFIYASWYNQNPTAWYSSYAWSGVSTANCLPPPPPPPPLPSTPPPSPPPPAEAIQVGEDANLTTVLLGEVRPPNLNPHALLTNAQLRHQSASASPPICISVVTSLSSFALPWP